MVSPTLTTNQESPKKIGKGVIVKQKSKVLRYTMHITHFTWYMSLITSWKCSTSKSLERETKSRHHSIANTHKRLPETKKLSC